MAGMLDYAMAWASRGFRVFPLIRGTRDGQLTSSHVNDATTDPNWINYWWGNGQDHNIGVATGNGLTVIGSQEIPSYDLTVRMSARRS